MKTDGPLFAMFPKSAPVTEEDTLLYNSPGENHVTTSPTRVFPDLEQILINNTNADTGSCPFGGVAPQVPLPIRECYSEFLPTSDYLPPRGACTSASRPATGTWRGGGNNSADMTLTLAANAGPFLVTSPNTAVTYPPRLHADGHVGQGQYGHPSDQHVQREDQPVHGRRAHVPDRARGQHRERRRRRPS